MGVCVRVFMLLPHAGRVGCPASSEKSLGWLLPRRAFVRRRFFYWKTNTTAGDGGKHESARYYSMRDNARAIFGRASQLFSNQNYVLTLFLAIGTFLWRRATTIWLLFYTRALEPVKTRHSTLLHLLMPILFLFRSYLPLCQFACVRCSSRKSA